MGRDVPAPAPLHSRLEALAADDRLAGDPGGIRADIRAIAREFEAATRVYRMPSLTVRVVAEEAPGQDWDLPARWAGKRPTSAGMDQLLVDVLTMEPTACFAPEDERAAGHREISCWASGLAYVLSTYLRRYLGGAIVYNDAPERK